ncbi:MAG: hypothetical protein II404_07575 [Prevotella sp.]|nr:hypothetical protein [Prevotella sp.]
MKIGKSIFIISCLMILFACGGKNTQTESADAATADSTVVMTNEKTDSIPNTPQSYSLTGTIGEDKASMTLDKNGNNVTGVVTRCEYCEPIDVKGTYQDDNITVEGFSQAGSHIKYELAITDNDVRGTEILSAEGEVEKQNVNMTIVEQ